MTASHIIKVLDAAFQNGFGFQCSGVLPEGSLVVAFLFRPDGNSIEEDQLTKQLQAEFKTDLVAIDEWIGKTYLKVFYTLYDHIPEILQFILDTNLYGFCLQSTLDVGYEPGSRFHPHHVEQRYIKQFHEHVESFWARKLPGETKNDVWKMVASFAKNRGWPLFCHFNWQTEDGKAFCRELHERVPDHSMYEKDDEIKSNYFLWPWWQKAAQDHKLFQYSKWWWVPPREPLQEEPEICSICLNKPANTMVLPCSHVVLCDACSRELAKKPELVDAKVCVQCRQPITEVLYESYASLL